MLADAVTSLVTLMTSQAAYEDADATGDIVEGDIVQLDMKSKPQNSQYLPVDNSMVDFDDPSMRYEASAQKVPYPELAALSRSMGGEHQSHDAVQGRSEYYDGSVLRGEYWYTAAGTRWTFSYISDEEGFHMTGINTEKDEIIS